MLGAIVAAISYTPIVRIHLGPISISPHGIGIAVGFLVGAWFMLPRSRAKGMPDEVIYPLFTRAAIGAILGARLAYVFNHFSEYDSILDALQIWRGGISLIGGFFGAILLSIPKIRSSRLSFWKVMDAAAPGMALGVTVGRIGDLVVADHLGKTTSFFFGYRCPPLGIATASPCGPTDLALRTPGAIVHQTALYDLLFAAVLLAVLVWFEKRSSFDGAVILMFGCGYGVARIIEDFLREDLRRFGLTGSQWVAVATLSVSLFVLLVRRRSPKWGHWDARPPDAGEPPVTGRPEAAPTLGDQDAKPAEESN